MFVQQGALYNVRAFYGVKRFTTHRLVQVWQFLGPRRCGQVPQNQLIRRDVKRFRGGLVFKAHRRVYRSRQESNREMVGGASFRGCLPPVRISHTGTPGGTVFRVQGSGFRVHGAGCRVQGSGFRVQGSGCSMVCRQRAHLWLSSLCRAIAVIVGHFNSKCGQHLPQSLYYSQA